MNVSGSGLLNTDEVANPLLLHCNTPDGNSGLSPAELFFAVQLVTICLKCKSLLTLEMTEVMAGKLSYHQYAMSVDGSNRIVLRKISAKTRNTAPIVPYMSAQDDAEDGVTEVDVPLAQCRML